MSRAQMPSQHLQVTDSPLPPLSAGLAPGGPSLALFCCCAAATHLCSALTHVYPDSHSLVGFWFLVWGVRSTVPHAHVSCCCCWHHDHI